MRVISEDSIILNETDGENENHREIDKFSIKLHKTVASKSHAELTKSEKNTRLIQIAFMAVKFTSLVII